ncbi:MAG: erythromycin esterase family protein [Firmicutes bacterium]|nr:erythromycin esterase family protein [Bacillota bacterium]
MDLKKLFISLIIITMLTGCSVTDLKDSEFKNKEVYNYLEKNYSIVDVESDNFEDVNIIDTENKRVFLTGEKHGNKGNMKLREKFLKYFKKETDFKYYLCELSYSMGYFLNKYLETGDTEILDNIYKPLKGTYAWNKDNYNHWKMLYEYNKKLPKESKIKVVGIDIEHQPSNALRCIYDVLPKEEPKEEISEMINEFKAIMSQEKKVNHEGLKDFSKRLKKDIEENKKEYKEYLEDDLFIFNLVNNNILYRYEAYGNDNFNSFRDEKIYENFEKIYNNNPDEKYFGQWGIGHIYQREQKDVKWMATLMNDSKELKDKIVSIVYSYDDCKYMSKNNGSYEVKVIDNFDHKLDLIKDFTLFRLDGENSPFNDELIWPYSYSIEKKGVTTDYFQYLVVIKGLDATEPLD